MKSTNCEDLHQYTRMACVYRSVEYSDESYMTKRHTTRQGFNGNYRRSNSNEIIKTTSPVLVTSTGQSILEPRVAQPLRKHLSESPVSSANPPKASETLVTLPSVVSDSGKPSSESKTHLEKGPVVHKPQQQQQPPPVPPKTFTSSTDRLADISPKDNVEKRASPQQQIRLSPTTSKVTNLDEASRQLAFLNNFNNTQDIAPSLTPKSESSDKVTTTKTSSTFSHSKIVSVRRSSETLNGLHNVNGDSHSSSPDTSLTRSNLTQNSPPRTPPTTSNSFNSPNSSSSFSSPSSLSTPRANEEISKKEESNDEEKEKSEAKGETSPTSLSPVHVRQKSMEEIACEKAAAVVAIQIVEQDKELSDVILPPPDHKMTTDYMTGLFDTNVVAISPSSSFVVSPRSREDNKENRRSSGTLSSSTENLSPYWSPPTVASLQSKIRDEGLKKEEILREMGVANTSLQRQKEELEQRIVQKLAILRSEKEALKEEQLDNDHLGKQVTSVVEKKVQNKGEFDKYKLYIDELEKVMYLLLKLSGRLARAENAFMSLPPDADDKEKNQLIVKRDEASEKHTDAKLLKRGIDRRCQQVSGFLSKYLTKEEYEHFNYFVKMKAKLTMDQQELEDKIKLGEEQLGALRTNMAAGSTKNGKGD